MESEVRKMLEGDIEFFRKKAGFYRENHLHEAAVFAERLAANLELALTTLPRDDDIDIV